MPDDSYTIRNELRPGDIGRIVQLHGTAYDPLSFGLAFEAFVARTLAEFFLDDGGRGRIWLAERDGRLAGCTAIVHRPDRQAQLRWVLLDESARGRGLGRRLVESALNYCRAQGMTGIFLETTDGLDASSALYESLGFRVTDARETELWSGPRALIVMRLDL